MLKLYNTLARKIEEFKPHDDQVVRMYTCGPTVYNYAHIGNLRAFIVADLLYRTLNFDGYDVDWVMNITDIDDKTIRGAIAEFGPKASTNDLYRLTQKYLDAFMEDLKRVNIMTEGIRFIRVTDKMAEMQKFITDLIDKGYAYKADDGSTYFSIEKYQEDFNDYGHLVGDKFLEGKKIGARVAVDEYEKENLSDFALWKAHSASDGNIFWDHPILGKGRPGWHIECSVINFDAFEGQPTDIHTGGVDLMFPHHTNEIAQSQALLGKGNFVKHWLHSEHLLVDNKKMAKSVDNFYTLKDIKNKVGSDLALRYLFLQSHYKSQQNFTDEALRGAQVAVAKLQNFNSGGATPGIGCAGFEQDFQTAINNDLNFPEAIATGWDLIGNQEYPKEARLKSLLKFDEVLGLKLDEQKQLIIPDEVKILLDQRERARIDKDFAKSDQLRDEIAKHGFEVLDTPEGKKIKKASK